MTTDERLQQVEGQLARVRWLNGCLIGCALVFFALWGFIQTFGPETAWAQSRVKEIRATRFIVEDEKGKARGTLSSSTRMNPNTVGPALSLSDENGRSRLVLIVSANGPALRLYDENGKFRAAMESGKDGSASLLLLDQDQKPRASLAFVNKERGSVMTLLDANGKIRAAMDMDTSTGWPAMRLYDENEKGRIALVLLKEGPVLRLVGADDKPVWSVP